VVVLAGTGLYLRNKFASKLVSAPRQSTAATATTAPITSCPPHPTIADGNYTIEANPIFWAYADGSVPGSAPIYRYWNGTIGAHYFSNGDPVVAGHVRPKLSGYNE